MIDNNKLLFYTSIGSIDIWYSQNTKTGITKYTFFYKGQTYERDTIAEITSLAHNFSEINDRQRE